MTARKFLLCCVVAATSLLHSSGNFAIADIVLPKLFSDHMVLQRNRAIKIWGKADANEELTVSFRGFSAQVKADSAGNWSTVVATGKAGGPFQLEITSNSSETGVVFHDVLVGEVWICSGQSNMQWPISGTDNAKETLKAATGLSDVRAFNIQAATSIEPLADFGKVDPWFCCTPDSISQLSAVAWLFGKELSQQLDIPIGLVVAARGGTTLEAWTPYDAVQQEGSFDQMLEHWQSRGEPSNPNRVSNLYNAMIAPIIGFGFQGIIWYQGESNVGRGAQYQRLFPLMIESWRKNLDHADCPFLFVQLAPYRYDRFSPEALPEVWEAQLNTFKSVANTGMVVTTDCGDFTDIHPQNKNVVARRLAAWALNKCYSDSQLRTDPADEMTAKPDQMSGASEENSDAAAKLTNGAEKNAAGQSDGINGSVADASGPEADTSTEPDENSSDSISSPEFKSCSGPIFESAQNSGQEIICTFRFATDLRIEGEGNGFTICSNDKQFLPATIRIEGNSVAVSHPEIDKPVAVRFNWNDNPTANLVNGAGLPASPFRTDSFLLISSGIEF